MLRKVTLICVGSLKKDYLKSLEKENSENINLIRINESNVESESNSILDILEKINNKYSILFDLDGSKLNNSINMIINKYNKGENLCFIIGGSNGVSKKLKKYCDLNVKLSNLTYTHQIFKISAMIFIRKFIYENKYICK